MRYSINVHPIGGTSSILRTDLKQLNNLTF